jgi:membrane protein
VGGDALLTPLHRILVAGGLDRIQVVPVGDAGSDPTTLAAWLEELTSDLTSVNLAAIGWLGVAVIIYAAIGLLVTIENSFNVVYRAPAGRAWTRRVPLYWFLLTVSPLLVAAASYVNTLFATWTESVDAWQFVPGALRLAASLGVRWGLLWAVYLLVPNSSVALRPALIGAFVAAVLIKFGEHTLWASLGGAFSVNQLYGSLGLVPLFMFWVYLMWLFVLFGLQVSATLQHLHGRKLDEVRAQRAASGLAEPSAVLAVMQRIVAEFERGRTASLHELAHGMGLSEPLVRRIVERLAAEGWIVRVEAAEPRYALARPPETLAADQLLAVGFELVDRDAAEHCALVPQLRAAQLAAVTGVSLASPSGPAVRGER